MLKPVQPSFETILSSLSSKSRISPNRSLIVTVSLYSEFPSKSSIFGSPIRLNADNARFPGPLRTYFPDESLYYPYCDCEDRSILFSRLIRDLLGLPCVLVYYPGHLATAVCFSESVNGDYIIVNGKRFVVCDPTYIGASVGATMPNMDNSTAKVIIL